MQHEMQHKSKEKKETFYMSLFSLYNKSFERINIFKMFV